MAQNLKTSQSVPAAGSRPDAHQREARRAKAILKGVISVVVLCVMSFAGSAAPASAAATTRTAATAQWRVTGGCVETIVNLTTTQSNAGTPSTFFFLDQSQTCEDPNSSLPVLQLVGSFTGGQLRVSPNFKAQLVANIPVTCYAYELGACDQEPYNTDSVSLNLSWTSTGGILRTSEDGMTCLYKYGTATGAILLGGGMNILATDGGTLLADTSETNVQRCVG